MPTLKGSAFCYSSPSHVVLFEFKYPLEVYFIIFLSLCKQGIFKFREMRKFKFAQCENVEIAPNFSFSVQFSQVMFVSQS